MKESASVYKTFSEAWVTELRKTLLMPASVSPRGMITKEREFVQFEVMEPRSFPVRAEGRTFRDTVGYLEGISNVAQVNIPTAFTDRVKNFWQFSDDGIFWGAYGARLHGQIGDLVAKLRADPDSRQAVLTIFDGGRDLAAAKKDIPCTVALHFLLRDVRVGPEDGDVQKELNLRVVMRSNDLWLGTPYDLTQFAILQLSIAQALGVRPGYYVHSVGSLHIYERDFGKAAEIDFPKTLSVMPFPLWSTSDLSGIVGRAANLLTANARAGWDKPVDGGTVFESTVWNDLHGR